MNNNRNSQSTNSNNNRRRGRGNNNRPQGGGGGRGEQLNRIDSRARGNAPQMLEKYKKLASDAHLNGDRVQAEYYLQFADHYFRVIADQRLRQEEQRAPRSDRQEGSEPYARQDENEGEGEGEDYGNEGDFPGYDQPNNYRREEPREPRNEQRNEQREAREPREPRNEPRNEQREPREPREFREQPRETQVQAPPQRPRAELSASSENAEQGGGNSFTRNENRGTRGLRPRREPRPPRNDAQDAEPMGLDPSLLPPAIAEAREAIPVPVVEDVEAPAPRRRGRPRKVVGDAPVETVNG